MLKIDSLSKTYANGVHALNNVNLDIPRGMFGLLGPNGAGKSSLMRTLSTLQEADSGTATLSIRARRRSTCYATRMRCAVGWVTCRRISACTRKSARWTCWSISRCSRA